MVKKTTICVSVDIDTLMTAKTKVNNISKYVNECLSGLIGKSIEDTNKEQLEQELKELQSQLIDVNVKMGICRENLKSLEESKNLRLKQEAEEEQFKRWKCGACGHFNYMDILRCDGCRLPTKNDPKTTIVSIKGE